MRRIAVIAVVLLIAGGVVGWLYWRQSREAPLKVSGFIEADQIRVGSRVGGRVSRVAVTEGQRVAGEQPLFEIEPFDLKETLAEAEAQLAAAQAEWARLKAGPREEEITQARARQQQAEATLSKLRAGPRTREISIARERLNAAKANLEFAEFEHARLTKLAETSDAARFELERASRTLKSSRAELAVAEQELGLLEEGTRAEEIAEAEAVLAEAREALKLLETGYRAEDVARAAAQVDAAKSSVAAIQARIEELTVAAPVDSVVEAIDLHPGDLVAANAPAVSLLDLGHLWVRAYVPESWLGHVRLDQSVWIVVDSFPGERFRGRVIFIASEAEFTPRNVQTPEERSKQVFRIKVALEEGLDRLRVGMAADVMFDGQDRGI